MMHCYLRVQQLQRTRKSIELNNAKILHGKKKLRAFRAVVILRDLDLFNRAWCEWSLHSVCTYMLTVLQLAKIVLLYKYFMLIISLYTQIFHGKRYFRSIRASRFQSLLSIFLRQYFIERIFIHTCKYLISEVCDIFSILRWRNRPLHQLPPFKSIKQRKVSTQWHWSAAKFLLAD